MGNTTRLAGRRSTLAVMAMAVAALALIAIFMALGAPDAQALPTFTQAVNGVGPCSSCHSYTYGDSFHKLTTHSLQSCTKCHTSGTSTPPAPSACANCHGGSASSIIAGQTLHQTVGCATTDGCHGYVSPTPTPTSTASGTPTPTPTATDTGTPTPTPTATATPVTTIMTVKVPASVTLGKVVKSTCTAGPVAELTGAKVTYKIQRKAGTKWVTMKSGSALVGATGGCAWKYKPAKKGVYRELTKIAATTTYTGVKLTKKFKVV